MDRIETVPRKLAQLPLPNPSVNILHLPASPVSPYYNGRNPSLQSKAHPPDCTLDPNSSSLLGRLSLLIIPSVFSFSDISNHSFSTSSFPLRIRCTLLLLLSHFSHVRLCATPETAAHQAPLSLGFSRQEHWSGLPFPSPMHESEK